MERCKTCKWWGLNKDDHRDADVYTNAKRCGHPYNQFATTEHTDGTYTEKMLVIEDRDTPSPPNAANVLDGSGYWGALYPGPDFGCVNHEPAE